MDFALIEKLMRMLEASSLDELDVTEGSMRIRLAKQKGGQLGPILPVARSVEQAVTEAVSQHATIAAGMAGTFYRSPSPGSSPFVEIGTEIGEGDQVAIIEAMKMLNPVEADRGGVIRAILVEDGGSVEPGTALFEIETR